MWPQAEPPILGTNGPAPVPAAHDMSRSGDPPSCHVYASLSRMHYASPPSPYIDNIKSLKINVIFKKIVDSTVQLWFHSRKKSKNFLGGVIYMKKSFFFFFGKEECGIFFNKKIFSTILGPKVKHINLKKKRHEIDPDSVQFVVIISQLIHAHRTRPTHKQKYMVAVSGRHPRLHSSF